MGNTLLPPETSSQILNKYWHPIRPSLFQNKATHQLIQQKKMTFRTEEEMNYVFNCLLKRMNNYHPNAVKIVYLRKLTEALPCDCGKRFVILVYVEHLENRLKQLVQDGGKLAQRKEPLTNTQKHKCVCIGLLKGALFLNERYGSFKVTQNNTWINGASNPSEFNSSQWSFLPPTTKSEYPHNVKLKIWISSEQEQNFPDQSCEQKQMIKSILDLIQHTLLPTKLCKCYSSPQILDKYVSVIRLKQLVDMIKQDHEHDAQTTTLNDNLSNINIINKQPHFQRTIRSFSSNEPGNHPSHPHNNHQLINQNSFQTTQRKYTSIEYLRKQPVDYNSAASEKKASKPAQFIPLANLFFSPNAKQLHQQTIKHHSFQHPKISENPVKNDQSLTKNDYRAIVKFQVPQQTFHPQKTIHTFNQQTKVQPFNPKIKHRHGNTRYSRPIIGIADLSGELNSNIPSVTILNHHSTPKQQATQKSQSPSVTIQMPTQRENLLEQGIMTKMQKIRLEQDLSKRQVEISLDRGTNPTDRSRIDISFKSEQKRQAEGIHSSRKNISVIPISLDSTNGAAQSFKPVLHSHQHLRKPTSSPVPGELQCANIKESSLHPDKQKKQSGSSIKSERNYTTYQINLANSKTKEELGKLIPNKLSSHNQVLETAKQKVQQPADNKTQRQKSYSFVQRIQTMAIATPNGDMGRLRQSEYIPSGKNSLLNSQSISIDQIKPLKEEKIFEIGSLKQMEARFPTLQNLQNYQEIGILKSQSHLFICQDENRAENPVKGKAARDIMMSQTNHVNLNSYHQSREQSFISNKKSSNLSLIENQKPKSQSFSSNPTNPRAPVPTEQLQNILTDKMPLTILREKDEAMQLQRVTEEEYCVKISNGTEREKMHHKKLSNPTFDKQYMKSKALKQEFSQLLGEPKEDSFKAFTQSKEKLVTLDRNEGRQTYSIYNESEYTTSEQHSKRQSQNQKLAGSGSAHPPLPGKQQGKPNKWRKPYSKQELQKELDIKKQVSKTPSNQQALRLTSSGHEDNSIKQKVRNKKAEFAELKNEMNSLLF